MPRVGGNQGFRLTRLNCIQFRAALSVCMLLQTTLGFAQPELSLGLPATERVAAPQGSPPVPLAVALDTRGDLTLQEATIEKALFAISASWRVNIVVGKDVSGNVSCIYKQAPLREVLDAILLANGYSYRAVGESLVVQRAQDVGSANPLFQSATIPIVHSDMGEVFEGARLLLSNQGQIKALNSARSILVVDYSDRIASIREFVTNMDAAAAQSTGGIPVGSNQQLQVSYFHTQYIPVDSAKEPLTAVLSQAGRVATMPDENRLVVVDYAPNIAMARRVLERIDRPVPQVRITALIYDISLQDVEQLGLNWSHNGKGNNLDSDGNPQQSLSFDSVTLIPFASGSAGGTATIRSLTRNFDINTVALLLQNANDARLLANPNVTVMENERAEMSSVQQIPFQQITQSELGGQIGTTEFKDVGITLRVTPTVASDGTVKLEVQQEFSRVAGFTENDSQPIIDTRIANTMVRVANRRTLVIGGLRQRSDTGEFNGIPFLKDVKFIGPLFRSRETNVRESELIVFLMPEIVGFDQDPSHREFMAQETVNCRLDRVPIAEGCNDGSGENCAAPYSAGQDQYSLPAAEDISPSIESLDVPPPPFTTAPAAEAPLNSASATPAAKSVSTALHQNYDSRYRSQSDNNKPRSLTQQPNNRTVKEDSRALLRLLQAQQK